MPAWLRGRNLHGHSVCVLALLLCVGGRCAGEGPALSALCDREQVSAGQTVAVTITATWEGTDGAQYIIGEAVFPKLHNLELADSHSSGAATPSTGGTRFERRLVYLFHANETGEAETGPIEVKYYSPKVKHEKVASAADDESAKAPLVRTLPSLIVNVRPGATSSIIPVMILLCAGGVILFFAIRLLKSS